MKLFKTLVSAYLLILVIPIIINLLTPLFSFNQIWNNGWFFVSLILFGFLLIIISSFLSVYLGNRINENDISTYNYLISIINLSNAEYYLRKMENNLPINIAIIKEYSLFINECDSVKNLITSKKLNIKIQEFKTALDQYISKRSLYTFYVEGSNDMYGFDSDFKEKKYELYNKRVSELDSLATEAYGKLSLLISFAKEMNIHKTN